MNERKKYLSRRVTICASLGACLLFLSIVCVWYMSLRYGMRWIAAAVLTVLAGAYAYAAFCLVIRPYRETKKVYEQFVLGYVISDFFSARYPLTPESDQAIRRLNEMIDRNNLLNVSKKQAEYLALQNQINPHFLYNTLEGIRSEALLAGLDSVAEMTEALATFFRYTISQVEHLVTLEDELANIENYYYIQQFRFGDKLSLAIEYEECDEDGYNELEILQYRLPKLTLQPIVENSIYHGIEQKVGKGHLVIRIGISDRQLRIRISDDGLGMSEDRLKRLNERLRVLALDGVEEEPNRKGGIAVVNVNNRIKLLFGEEYGIDVYSHEGAGTDVVVNLPLVRDNGTFSE
jgi:two-component system sensor histidine kinase YesM